jgi:hypothetical protein
MFKVKFMVIRSNIATSLQTTSFTHTNPPAARGPTGWAFSLNEKKG